MGGPRAGRGPGRRLHFRHASAGADRRRIPGCLPAEQTPVCVRAGGRAGRKAGPVVVMVSAHHSELDRVRGTLAGADAYFGKPADATALEHLLLRYGVKPPPAGAQA